MTEQRIAGKSSRDAYHCVYITVHNCMCMVITRVVRAHNVCVSAFFVSLFVCLIACMLACLLDCAFYTASNCSFNDVSDKAKPPAEFKHITKQRKRN